MIRCLLFLLSSVWDAELGSLRWRSVLRLSTLYSRNMMKSSTSAVCICNVVLPTLSHWLFYISSSISNSVNMFLMNFSRAGYPGQFLQRCNINSRLVVQHTTIAIKSLYAMSNFGNSTFLSSDSSAFLFNWVFTLEQKQWTNYLVF